MSAYPVLRGVVAGLSALLLVVAMSGPALAKADRVAICHMPDTPDEETLYVPQQAVKAHLKHGDYKGKCAPDTCTELNKPKYDGSTYQRQVLTLKSIGDEKITFYGDWSAVCPAVGFIGISYRWTGGWGSSFGKNCEPYDDVLLSTGTLPGVGELTWGSFGQMGLPVWTVTCTHEY